MDRRVVPTARPAPVFTGPEGVAGPQRSIRAPVRLRLPGVWLLAAAGWGGHPKSAAMYVNVVPEKNDGTTPYTLTVKDVPVDGFWSMTVYNDKGLMEKNTFDACSFDSVGGQKAADGSITLHFGGDPTKPNFLPIGAGWNDTVRLYQPRCALPDSTWKFPAPQPVD